MAETLLDRLLSLYPTAKRQNLKRMVEARRVTVNAKPARSLSQVVVREDQVEVAPTAVKPPATTTVDIDVIHEDDDVLVANKPAGLLTSTVPREPRPTLLAMVKEHIRAKNPRAVVGLIHRLDRDVSGLLVFSKNPPAYASLKSQLKLRTMKRVYTAVVAGTPKPASGRFKSYLAELADGTVRSTKTPAKSAQLAITDYQLLSQHADRALLRVSLLTGRKHQIRVHLSEHALPVVGDPLYGENHPAGRLMLHATHLSFTHPRTKRPMKFEAPIPQELRDALKEQ